MRVPQKRGTRGSLRWIQEAVNQHPRYLNFKISERCGLSPNETIQWVSPVQQDDFAEYRDSQFLDLLEVRLPARPLKSFWPVRGPQWDALGRTDNGNVLLVGAKANVPELVSDKCQAGEKSKTLIRRSLREVQDFLKVDPEADWLGKLYQYTNRLAHLYLLRELNRVEAHLVFVYFVGATKVSGPQTVPEWEAALSVARGVLGLGKRHRLSNYIYDVFIDVREFRTGV